MGCPPMDIFIEAPQASPFETKPDSKNSYSIGMGFSTFLKIGDTASGFNQNLANKRFNRKLNFAKG